MKHITIFVVVASLIGNCQLIENKPLKCFSCTVQDQDSCKMTDILASFEPGNDSVYNIRTFSRCGSGALQMVRFYFTGGVFIDSAYVSIHIDESKYYFYPLELGNTSSKQNEIKYHAQYLKGGYMEIPIRNALNFSDSCSVAFVLRLKRDYNDSSRNETAKFQNIFIQWSSAEFNDSE